MKSEQEQIEAKAAEDKKAETADVQLGFVSFNNEKTDDGPLHKRDPSFTGVHGLFEDLNFGSDEELDAEVEKITGVDPSKEEDEATKDRHKRDPSFSGVVDLFDEEEAAEMGFGPKAKESSEIDLHNLFSSDNQPQENAASGPNERHKRDPSYSGVKDLFEEEEEEEEEAQGFAGPVGGLGQPQQQHTQQGAGRTNAHLRDVSFGGVKDLFAEEMPDEYTNRENTIDELRKKVDTYENELQDYQETKEELNRYEEENQSLRQQVIEKNSLYQQSKEREEQVEQEMTQLRQDMMQKLQQAAISENASEEAKQNAQKVLAQATKEQGEIKTLKEHLTEYKNKEEKLKKGAAGKDQEIKALRESLDRERNEIEALTQKLKEEEVRTENIKQELEIRKEATPVDYESNIESTLQQKASERQIIELNQKLNDMSVELETIQKAKRQLAISACVEMDRLRVLFREMQNNSVPVDQQHANTVG
eukprot:UN31108